MSSCFSQQKKLCSRARTHRYIQTYTLHIHAVEHQIPKTETIKNYKIMKKFGEAAKPVMYAPVLTYMQRRSSFHVCSVWGTLLRIWVRKKRKIRRETMYDTKVIKNMNLYRKIFTKQNHFLRKNRSWAASERARVWNKNCKFSSLPMSVRLRWFDYMCERLPVRVKWLCMCVAKLWCACVPIQ